MLLRNELGMNQAQFASEVMKCSLSAVSKYETTTPPRGEALVRLMAISRIKLREAQDDGRAERFIRFGAISSILESVRSDEINRGIESQLTAVKEQVSSVLAIHLNGRSAVLAGEYFKNIIAGLQSQDRSVNKIALSAIGDMRRAARKCRGAAPPGSKPSAEEWARRMLSELEETGTTNDPLSTR